MSRTPTQLRLAVAPPPSTEGDGRRLYGSFAVRAVRRCSRHTSAPNGGRKVPLVSDCTYHAIVRQGVPEPGVEFLQKPFALAALARRIREILGGGDGHNLLLPFDS